LESEEKKTSRRKFLKYLGAGLAGFGIGGLLGSKFTIPVKANAPPSTTIQPDIISAYLHTGPPGTYSYIYNSDGTIASYTYVNLTVTFTYNADKTIATSVSIDSSITVTDTYAYNTDGTVSGVTRT